MNNSLNKKMLNNSSKVPIGYKNINFKQTAKKAFVACILFGLTALSVPVHSETVFLKGTAYQTGIALKDIKVGSSEVLVSNAPIKRVAVADPSVADLRILSDTTALVRGKKVGKTTLLIWEGKDPSVRPTRFDITVKRDISDLIASLKMIDPNIMLDYVIVSSNRLEAQQQTPSFNGAYSTSYRTSPENVEGPTPSVIVNNQPPQNAQVPVQQAGAAGGAGGASFPGSVTERFILKGKVKSADVITKALTSTATYLGEDATMKIVTRNGGVLVDQISSILTPNAAAGGGAAGGGGNDILLDPPVFTSNITSNIGNGTIISNTNGTIVSFMEVDGKAQIAVRVRFYEVSKTVGKTFKAQVFPNFRDAKIGIQGPAATVSGQQLGLIPTSVDPNTGSFLTDLGYIIQQAGALGAGGMFAIFPKINLNVAIEALESRGELKVLAEPTIVVTSGEIGQFRVGGEVPIPSATASLGAVVQTFQYVPFGISLNFLPTITDNDSILMNIKAQTRDLDSTNPFAAAGVPAFKTRKVDTQVDMDPSQALVLAGLINSTSTRNLDKIPLIGDIPILGALARSKNFARGDSELIVVLSPEIVRPANPAQIYKPLALDAGERPGSMDVLPPLKPDLSRVTIPTAPGAFNAPANGPVDLSKPATVNDLDNIYR